MVTSPELQLITTPIAVHNLHGPDKNVSHRHGAITMFLDAAKGGLGGFNEFNAKDTAFMKAEAAKRGLSVSRVGLNGIVWDPTIYHVGKPRVKKIMQGGHVGADGVATPGNPHDDDRRVGPNRYGLYYPVSIPLLGLEFELVATHLMARTFSVHKWRIKLFNRSLASLGAGVLGSDGFVFGDMNDPHQIDLPGVADVSVPAPPDMGKQHYTQIHRWGNHIYIHDVKAVNTPSDHHLLKGKITFYRAPQAHLVAPPSSPTPTPRPKLPKPGTAVKWKKYGAPVTHPWAAKYNKPGFKKRRPVLYKRIHNWRAAYKRRL